MIPKLKNAPPEAQKISEETYAGCMSKEGKTKSGERKCSRIAISQVKKKFKRKDGKWVKRNYVDNSITPEQMCNCDKMWNYEKRHERAEISYNLDEIEDNGSEIRLPITLTRQGVMNGTFKPNDELNQTGWYDDMKVFIDHIPDFIPRPRDERELDMYVGHVEDKDYGYDKKQDEVTIQGTAVLKKSKLPKTLVNELKEGNVPISIEYWRKVEDLETPEVYKNKEYYGIERDMFIDDVAIMYSQNPACTIKDGCGIGLNKKPRMEENSMEINENAKKLAEMLVNEELIPEGKYDKYVNKLSEYFATNAIVRKVGKLTEVVKNKDEEITKLKEEQTKLEENIEKLTPLAEQESNRRKEKLEELKKNLIELNPDYKDEYEAYTEDNFETAEHELAKINKLLQIEEQQDNGNDPALPRRNRDPNPTSGPVELPIEQLCDPKEMKKRVARHRSTLKGYKPGGD
jgi:hypothetical protein